MLHTITLAAFHGRSHTVCLSDDFVLVERIDDMPFAEGAFKTTRTIGIRHTPYSIDFLEYGVCLYRAYIFAEDMLCFVGILALVFLLVFFTHDDFPCRHSVCPYL